MHCSRLPVFQLPPGQGSHRHSGISTCSEPSCLVRFQVNMLVPYIHLESNCMRDWVNAALQTVVQGSFGQDCMPGGVSAGAGQMQDHQALSTLWLRQWDCQVSFAIMQGLQKYAHSSEMHGKDGLPTVMLTCSSGDSAACTMRACMPLFGRWLVLFAESCCRCYLASPDL